MVSGLPDVTHGSLGFKVADISEVNVNHGFIN